MGQFLGSIESLTLCETNMAMKNGPVEDVFPIEAWGFSSNRYDSLPIRGASRHIFHPSLKPMGPVVPKTWTLPGWCPACRESHEESTNGDLKSVGGEIVDASFRYPTCRHTVDARNPTPFGMYKTAVNNGIATISTGAGFLPSTVLVKPEIHSGKNTSPS